MKFAIGANGGQSRQEYMGLEQIVEHVVRAEELGFSGVTVPDHYVFEAIGQLQREMPAYEVFTVLATLAQRTQRIKLMTHVICLLFRHPAMNARLFAQIDEASGGRVVAGVGAGWTKVEFEMMGIPFPPISERLAMLDEQVAIMRGLWTESSFSYQGKYWTVTEAACLPKPVQKPGLPLMIGGSGNGILRRAGEWADIVHMVPRTGRAGTTTMEEVRVFNDNTLPAKLERVRVAEAAAGRPRGSVRLASTIFQYAMTASHAETLQVAEALSGFIGMPPEEILTHPVALVGTPDEMIVELKRREKKHGLAMLGINFANGEDMQRFAKEVMPSVES